MYLSFHTAFDEMPEAEFSAYATFFSDVLYAHRCGHIIAVIRPHLNLRLLDTGWFGRQELAILNQISVRSNDYKSAFEISERRIIVCPQSVEAVYSIQGRDVHVSAHILNSAQLTTQKFLLSENHTDILLVAVLAELVFGLRKFPRQFVKFRPVSGGGSTTAQNLAAEAVSPQRGLAICDRDVGSVAISLKVGTTADTVHKKAVELHLMNLGCFGPSDRSPFFGLDITWGRSIENWIGPHLLEVYFSANTRRDERRGFVSAFPQFPSLDEIEWQIWRNLNLKNGTHDLTDVYNALKEINGSIPPRILSRSKYFSALFIPADVIRWVIENRTGTRWENAVRRGLLADLTSQSYSESVNRLSSMVRDMCAGDNDAMRA